MALTQSARLPGPTWDEEVVPALRKRLESESRTIARRLSYIEDPDSAQRSESSHSSQTEYPKKNGSSSRTRPSQPSRRSDESERVNGSGKLRARTYSQPFSTGMVNGDANGILSSSSSHFRPISRQTEPKPTRIPKAARSQTGSTASPNLSVSTSPVLNGHYPSELSPPTFTHSNTSHSTISVHTPQSSGLLNEPPPFAPGSTYSSQPSSNDDLEYPPRPSTESEEQPFEHWYRGEVSRNGGVGELRVGTRKEMLDIANYGHQLKSQDPKARNAITDAIEKHRGRRQRAGSISGIGAKERESFYMDEERANQVARVLDEAPLTDIDGEMSQGSDYYDEYSHAMHVEYSTAPEPPPPWNRSTTPTPSNLPRPSSRQRTTTPTPMSSRSDPLPSSSSSTPARNRQPQPRSVSGSSTTTTPTQKRGASPGTPSSAAKKSRTAASKATRAKLEAARKEEEQNRRSVAHYPAPDDNMENAIPQWTQPVPVDGNWDNVVLPVVARKQGLNGYETTDGSPRPKPPQPVEPAPGTFGYDHSKYRPGDHFAPVQLDEFGRPARIMEEPDGDSQPPRPPISTPHDEIRVGQRVPSPVPFSHYAPQKVSTPQNKLEPVSNNATKLEVADARPEIEDSAGCCKCVVM